ncbi:DUF1569 domain-containing protein [Polaribacter cellanae]|uniref:DUF1569 domain-containing protein n=1 Tax=Polaribacter cellanae TaxID=2818493 RepID=UPI00349EB87A
MRASKVNWVNFLNFEDIKNTLSTLKTNAKPLFGKMNGQQMVEHLAFLMKISNGKIKADYFVEDEKSARRKAFLNTDGELQVGFKASMLSEEPIPAKFNSLEESINDLILQIEDFQKHFKTAKLENHPFFGELDYKYWQKFHVKHFTHHFKQFGLV